MIVESDCLKLVKTPNNKTERGNWKIYPFLQEFHQLKSSFNRINWCWISREANRAADAAAKLAKMGLCSVDWNCGPPIPMMEGKFSGSPRG